MRLARSMTHLTSDTLQTLEQLSLQPEPLQPVGCSLVIKQGSLLLACLACCGVLRPAPFSLLPCKPHPFVSHLHSRIHRSPDITTCRFPSLFAILQTLAPRTEAPSDILLITTSRNQQYNTPIGQSSTHRQPLIVWSSITGH